ncbi:reverse transcriptase domain-containing protein [Tanacetum coccineum]
MCLVKQNLDIFAWKPADMTGVPRNIAEHRLNIREGYSPVRQKKKGQAPERNKAKSQERSGQLRCDAGIMKEVHYHSWLSNPVMVKKFEGTWRMFVDFKIFQRMPQRLLSITGNRLEGGVPLWFELEGYDIQYRPRTAIKGQILADFIVERPEEESPDELMAQPEVLPEPWTLFTDGSSYVDGSGAGLILTNPEGTKFTYAMRFRFEATNNEAEYEALIAGLWIAEKIGVLVEELKEKSINEKEILDIVEEEGNTWMTPICEYLPKKSFRRTKKKARAIGVRNVHPPMLVRDTPAKQMVSERANRSQEKGIKARLDERSKDWIEELPMSLGPRT